MNLTEMYEISREHDTHKHDYTAPVAIMSFDNKANLSVKTVSLWGDTSSIPLAPTDWVWGQIFSKLGPSVFGKGSNKSLPRDYMLAIPRDLLAENLNRRIANANGSQWLVRAYDDRARAVLSNQYAVVANTMLIEKFMGVVQDQQTPDFQLVRPYVDAERVYIKSVWKNVDGGSYGLGVLIGNGETGNSKLVFKPLIQRHSCTNSIVIDDDNGMDIRHVGDAEYHLYRLNRVIMNVFKLSADWLNQYMIASETPIEDFTTVLDRLAKDNGWDERVKTSVAFGTEGKQTLGGLIDGISYAAHDVFTDPDEQIRMNTLAGSFLRKASQFVEV